MADSKNLTCVEDYVFLPREELIGRIIAAKKQKNILLLAHNYQRLEIQHCADIVGDSLELSRRAQKAENQIIVFCGVHFMAESVKVLSPNKKVILPERRAGCPMAEMITAEKLREFKKEHPGAVVVCYVNSSAEVKAESDICCTSSNAVAVVRSVMPNKILFVPDKNLAAYCRKITGADITAWDGHCYVHNRFTLEDVAAARAAHPAAVFLAHPECPPEIVNAADSAASTSGMAKLVAESDQKEFILGTEMGLIDQLNEKHPDKKIYPLSGNALCVNMKKTNLASVAFALEHEKWEITVPEEIQKKAFESLKKMVEI